MPRKVTPPNKETVRNAQIRRWCAQRFTRGDIAKHVGLSHQRVSIICKGVVSNRLSK